MDIGVLEFLAYPARRPAAWLDGLFLQRQTASVVPQAVAAWCRQLGHNVHYATYFGVGDPAAAMPTELDVLFIRCCTYVAPLAYAISKLYRKRGTCTVIGGPHARSYPLHCLNHFDVVVSDCDRELLRDIIHDRTRGGVLLTSAHPPTELPRIEERMSEVRRSSLGPRGSQLGAVVPVLSSLGCPNACDFCIDWQTEYSVLPFDRLAADMSYASRTLPQATLAFQDPNFGLEFGRTMAAVETVPASRRVAYGFETSLSNLPAERLPRLRETRCQGLIVGLESWSKYGNKAQVDGAVGQQKLDKVVDHCNTIRDFVPYLQVGLILGLDCDEGAEPFELTRDLIGRAPRVRPRVLMPIPFGGTPMARSLHRQGRILPGLPFMFQGYPHLTFVPKNYDPVTYLREYVALYEHITSGRVLRARLRRGQGVGARAITLAKHVTDRAQLAAHRRMLRRLEADPVFLAYHDGTTSRLPDHYVCEYRDTMGRYADLVPIEEAVPQANDWGANGKGYRAVIAAMAFEQKGAPRALLG